MKKILLFFLLFINVCFAQDSAKYNNTHKPINLVVKTDLFLPVLYYFENSGNGKAISFTIEKLLAKRHSVQLYSLFFKGIGKGGNPLRSEAYIANGYQLSLQYKFFVSKKRPHSGYYIGAFGLYSTLHTTNQFIDYQIKPAYTHNFEDINYNMGCGFINGVQFYLYKRIVIDCMLGLGVTEAFKNTVLQGDIEENRDPKAYITAAINIGYKF